MKEPVSGAIFKEFEITRQDNGSSNNLEWVYCCLNNLKKDQFEKEKRRKRMNHIHKCNWMTSPQCAAQESADLCETISVPGSWCMGSFMARGALWMGYIAEQHFKEEKPPLNSICTLATICHRHYTTAQTLIYDSGGCVDSSHRFKGSVFTFLFSTAHAETCIGASLS